jgi:CRISPR-associated protein Cst2
LDAVREKEAEEVGLEKLESEKSYRLPLEERIRRVAALLEGLAHLEGGANLARHYTDVNPDIVFVVVTRGGNHILGHIIGTDQYHHPVIKVEAFREILEVFADDILSNIYVGWVGGYLDEERARFEEALYKQLAPWAEKILIYNPRKAFQALVRDLQKNPDWLA